METIIVYKPVGKTPLHMIQLVKEKFPALQTQAIGFAGRLDPMAEGLVLLLVGDTNNKRKAYERLPKVYETVIALGIQTDTYDALGILQNIRLGESHVQRVCNDVLPTFIGKYMQEYPSFSSPRVKGKPLFYWAREGKIDDIVLPKKSIEVYGIDVLKTKKVMVPAFVKDVTKRISTVEGDFRQGIICEAWNEFAKQHADKVIETISLRITCSSGTYIRALAHAIGKAAGVGAIASTIRRTRIGEFSLKDAAF